jgi:hypothetical protein
MSFQKFLNELLSLRILEELEDPGWLHSQAYT